MRRGRSTGTPTAAQRARFDAIRDSGCIACRMLGLPWMPCHVHHLTVGGRHGQKRRGHDYTIGLCPYHHVGEDAHRWALELGPSYAREPRAFRERFGDDEALLAYQERLIEERRRLIA